MAGERTLPGLSLHGFWTEGSNGYRTQHSGNLRILSALVQSRVIDRTIALPGSPTVGDMYIIPTGEVNAEAIAIRDYDTDDATAIWVYLTPAEGYIVYDLNAGEHVKFNGTTWEVLVSATAATTRTEKTASYETVTADFNGSTILHMNSASALTLTVGAGETGTETVHVVQGGLGPVTVTADTGVTLLPSDGLATSEQYALVSVIPWGSDTYLVKGEVA